MSPTPSHALGSVRDDPTSSQGKVQEYAPSSAASHKRRRYDSPTSSCDNREDSGDIRDSHRDRMTHRDLRGEDALSPLNRGPRTGTISVVRESFEIRDARRARDIRDQHPQLSRDARDVRDVRDPRDVRPAMDSRDGRDIRDPRDMRDVRDVRDMRDNFSPNANVLRDDSRRGIPDSDPPHRSFRDMRETPPHRDIREMRDLREVREVRSHETRDDRDIRDARPYRNPREYADHRDNRGMNVRDTRDTREVRSDRDRDERDDRNVRSDRDRDRDRGRDRDARSDRRSDRRPSTFFPHETETVNQDYESSRGSRDQRQQDRFDHRNERSAPLDSRELRGGSGNTSARDRYRDNGMSGGNGKERYGNRSTGRSGNNYDKHDRENREGQMTRENPNYAPATTLKPSEDGNDKALPNSNTDDYEVSEDLTIENNRDVDIHHIDHHSNLVDHADAQLFEVANDLDLEM